MKNYFPILLSKAGELGALTQLNLEVKKSISPVIEVLSGNFESTEAMLIQYWNFDANQVLIDLSLCDDFTIPAVRAYFHNLLSHGVNAIPVVQANSLNRYKEFVSELIEGTDRIVCFRTSNDSGGFNNFNDQTDILLDEIDVHRKNTILLLDLGYAQEHNFNNLSALAIGVINGLPKISLWKDIVVASGSFPENLGQLQPPNKTYRLERFEWNIWLTIQESKGLETIKYGDYGMKNPVYSEVPYAGTCSIKYTTENEFVVYRGILSGLHADGNGQYIIFANRLVRTTDYSGEDYCWGDKEILRISGEVLTDPRKRPGNPTTWVKISQNHHITLINDIL